MSENPANSTQVAGKVAYLVLGPESSGTRLLTHILMACDLGGDRGHTQRFVDSLDGAGDRIVVRQSVPHGGDWDGADKVLTRCKAAGYTVRVLAITRSFHCTAKSQVKERHVPTLEEAKRHIIRAIPHITKFVERNGLPVLYVTYEEIVNHLESLLRSLADWDLHCDILKLEQIVDRNQQYLTGITNSSLKPKNLADSKPTFAFPTIVKLTHEHVPPGTNWIRAFVKTNGSSAHIFTSLSENGAKTQPRAVFSAPRSNDTDNGILVCVVFDEIDKASNWAVQVIVSQQDATEYGPPVLYRGD